MTAAISLIFSALTLHTLPLATPAQQTVPPHSLPPHRPAVSSAR